MKSRFTHSCSAAQWLACSPHIGSSPGQDFQCGVCSTRPCTFRLAVLVSHLLKADVRPLIAGPSWASLFDMQLQLVHWWQSHHPHHLLHHQQQQAQVTPHVWGNKRHQCIKQERSLCSCSPLLSVCSDDVTTDQKRYSYTTSNSRWEAEKRSDFCFSQSYFTPNVNFLSLSLGAVTAVYQAPLPPPSRPGPAGIC